MTRLHPTRQEMANLMEVCRYCGAASGVWCTEPDDSWAYYLHADRFYQATGTATRYSGTDLPRDERAAVRLARNWPAPA